MTKLQARGALVEVDDYQSDVGPDKLDAANIREGEKARTEMTHPTEDVEMPQSPKLTHYLLDTDSLGTEEEDCILRRMSGEKKKEKRKEKKREQKEKEKEKNKKGYLRFCLAQSIPSRCLWSPD